MYGGIPRNYSIKGKIYGLSIFAKLPPKKLDIICRARLEWCMDHTLPILTDVEREIIKNEKTDK